MFCLLSLVKNVKNYTVKVRKNRESDGFLYLWQRYMENLAFEIQKIIKKSSKTGIVMHTNPDGDAMGSALALYEYIISQGKEAVVISPSEVAENLCWMPHYEQVLIFDEENTKHIEALETLDTVIFVDHSTDERNGNVHKYLQAPLENKVYIDHHPQPDMKVAVAYSEPQSAATCCVLYEIFTTLEATISTTMATCLYTGICTDTGNFRFGNNISQVFRIASELVKMRIDKEAITEAIYNTASENRMRLVGYALYEKMQLTGKHAAYISLSRKELDRFHVQRGDTDEIVNLPLSMKNITISAIFIENDDFIKISFRSRGDFDVNLLARNFFNGGGHKNASGGRFYGSMDNAIEQYKTNII